MANPDSTAMVSSGGSADGAYTGLNVVIVGAGVAGLACAFELSESAAYRDGNLKIVVLEGSARAGGIVETLKVTLPGGDTCLLESGPDSFITNRPYVLDLARRLGISDRIIPTNEKGRGAMVVAKGKLVKLPDGFNLLAPTKILPFLESPIMSWAGKLRVMAEPLLPQRTSLEDESLANFVRRRFGAELLEKIAQPMVGGIYVGDVEALSATMAAERFVDLERTAGSVIGGLMSQVRAQEQVLTKVQSQSSGQLDPQSDLKSDLESDPRSDPKSEAQSGVRYGLFSSFDQGMSVLVEALLARLRQSHDRYGNLDLCFDQKVKAVTVGKNAPWSVFVNDQIIAADHVVLALPSAVAARLLGDDQNRTSKLNNLLQATEAASSVVINFILEKSDIAALDTLDAFGVVIPAVEQRRNKINALAISFASKKFNGRAPDHTLAVRVFLGGVRQAQLVDQSDEALIDLALADLRKLIGYNKDATPAYVGVNRWPGSMPQYLVGHRKRLAEIDRAVADLKGLHLAGASYRGVGLPECVNGGQTVAREILRLSKERRSDRSGQLVV